MSLTKREKPKRKAQYKPGVPVPPSTQTAGRRVKRAEVLEIADALVAQNEGELLPKRSITPAVLPRDTRYITHNPYSRIPPRILKSPPPLEN